jgi:hypothetical protein
MNAITAGNQGLRWRQPLPDKPAGRSLVMREVVILAKELDNYLLTYYNYYKF